MNKLVTTLSIIGLLAASNISFAEGCDSCVPPLSGQFPNELNYTTQQLNDLAREVNNLNIDSDAIGASLVGSAWPKDAKEAGKKDKAEQGKGNAENKDPYLAFSELEREYAKSKLSLDYLYGLFLSYGERNIGITMFKNVLDYQLKICKQKEIEKNKYKNISNYEYKAYTQLLRELWEEAKEDLEDEMELPVDEIELRKSYKEKAVKWFLQKYREGGEQGIDGLGIMWGEQAKKKKKKCRAEKKLGKVARETNCLNLEKSWMKDEFNGVRAKVEKGDISKNKRQKIREISKEYRLMYFFRGDCKHCQGFTSVVKRFASKYEWDVMPVQIGEVAIEGFKNAKRDDGVAKKLGIKVVPALIAVHSKSKDMIPLAFGGASESEIEERVDAYISSEEQAVALFNRAAMKIYNNR